MYGFCPGSSARGFIASSRLRGMASARPSLSIPYSTWAPVLFSPLQVGIDLLTLREVAQLGDVVQHGLQIVVTNLAFERGDQCASFFCGIAAERACSNQRSVRHIPTCISRLPPSSPFVMSHSMPTHLTVPSQTPPAASKSQPR
jgi:hypothetical protein